MFVKRDVDGNIILATTYANSELGSTEEVADDGAELVAFNSAVQEKFLPPPPTLTKLVIIRRMTAAEQQTALALMTGNATTAAGLGSDDQMALAAQWWAATDIDPSDAATLAGFQAVYGSDRAAVLLAIP